jgi:hypothetical protein
MSEVLVSKVTLAALFDSFKLSLKAIAKQILGS